MEKLTARNRFSPFAAGLMLLGSLSLTTVQAQENHTYLVSVQDSNNEHLCNGSYIGNNQILFSPDCRNQNVIFPIPAPSSNPPSPLEDQAVIINGTVFPAGSNIEPGAYESSGELTPNINSFPIPIPGYPVQIVFTLPDGSQSQGEPITMTKTHPYTGDQLIATVNHTPNGIEALTLADNDLIDKLENSGDVKVDVVGRYYDTNSNNINVKTFVISPSTSCSNFHSAPLSRRLCLTPTAIPPSPICSIDVSNKSTGAPIVYATSEKKFLLGYKKKNMNYITSCDHWASASQYTNWLTLSNAKQKGLSIATAYDLGEHPLIAPHKLTVVAINQSDDQKFDLSNAQFQIGNHFNIKQNSCDTLLPGESCAISIYGQPNKPIAYEDMLTMNINGEMAGTYVVAKSIAKQLIRDDYSSIWSMRGWTKSGNGLIGGVSFDGTLADKPTLERSKYLVNPKNVTITYRASGDSQWLMFLHITRQGLFGDGPTLIPTNALSGTNDQWVTKTFDITEPGTYKASITKGFTFIGQPNVLFNAEISSICFNDCSN
ncbi:MAG: hypothetical protein JXR16_12555 [Bermanella sp.]